MQKTLLVLPLVSLAASAGLGFALVDARARIRELEVHAGLPTSTSRSAPASRRAQAPDEAPRWLEDRMPVAWERREPGSYAQNAATSGGAPAVASSAVPVDGVQKGDGVARAKVGSLVREEIAKADDERRAAREERWRARTEARLQDLAKDASLSEGEVENLATMLDAERVELSQLFADAREGGGGFGAVREKIADVRKATDANVEAVLGGAKLEKYRSWRDDDIRAFQGSR